MSVGVCQQKRQVVAGHCHTRLIRPRLPLRQAAIDRQRIPKHRLRFTVLVDVIQQVRQVVADVRHTRLIRPRLLLRQAAIDRQCLPVQRLRLLKVAVVAVQQPQQIEQLGLFILRDSFRGIDPPQALGGPDALRETIMPPQKSGVIIQRIQLDPVLFRQRRDFLVKGNDFLLRFRRYASGGQDTDQGPLDGDILPFAVQSDLIQLVRLFRLPIQERVPQQRFRGLLLPGLQQLHCPQLQGVQSRRVTALLREVLVHAEDVHLQRMELLGDPAPLKILFQPHSQDRLAVSQGNQRREFLVQPQLLRQQPLDGFVFGIQRDVLHAEHGLPVHKGQAVLQLHRAADQRIPAQFHDEVQLYAVDVGKDAVKVPQFPVDPLHEGPDALRGPLARGELHKIGVELRRVPLPEGRQRQVEFPHRIHVLLATEQDVKILRIPDCPVPVVVERGLVRQLEIDSAPYV